MIKQIIKKICIALSATVMSLALIGCSSDSDSSGSSVAGGDFVMGTECDYAPFNWSVQDPVEEYDYDFKGVKLSTVAPADQDNIGYCTGYEVWIGQYLASKLGKNLVIKKIAWDGLIPALSSGDIDAIIAGMTYTEDRENGAIDFVPTPYELGKIAVVVKGDSQYANATSLEDFRGTKWIAQANTSYDEAIDDLLNDIDHLDVTHLPSVDNIAKTVQGVKSGDADATFFESPAAKGVLKANPELVALYDLDIDFTQIGQYTDCQVAMKSGSRDGELYNAIEAAIAEITDDEKNALMDYAVSQAPTA